MLFFVIEIIVFNSILMWDLRPANCSMLNFDANSEISNREVTARYIYKHLHSKQTYKPGEIKKE